MPDRKNKSVDNDTIEFIEKTINTISNSITLDRETARKKVMQIFQVMDGLTNGNQMCILEMCMATHYQVFKDAFAKDEPGHKADADMEKMLALLIGLRMTLSISKAVFDHMTVEFYPEIVMNKR